MANDPYQVGNLNPQSVIDHYVVCQCCGLKFPHRAPAAERRHPARCGPCKPHRLDASTDDRLAAMQEHVDRVNQWATQARAKAAEMAEELRLNQAEMRDNRRQTAAALEDRNHWRSVAYAALEEHSQPLTGRVCTCGQTYPCATLRAMSAIDPHLVRPSLNPLVGAPAATSHTPRRDESPSLEQRLPLRHTCATDTPAPTGDQ